MSGNIYLDGNGKPVGASNPLPTIQSGSNVKLLDLATTIGAGTQKPVDTNNNYVFEVWGTASSFAVRLQAIGPSGIPRTLNVWDELNNTFISGDITTAGFYSVGVPQFTILQANLISVTGGNVSVAGGLGQ